MRPVKLGLMLVGLGDWLADWGAHIAGCTRRRTYLYPKALVDDRVPYAPPLDDD